MGQPDKRVPFDVVWVLYLFSLFLAITMLLIGFAVLLADSVRADSIGFEVEHVGRGGPSALDCEPLRLPEAPCEPLCGPGFPWEALVPAVGLGVLVWTLWPDCEDDFCLDLDCHRAPRRPQPVPEPGSFALLLAGGAAYAVYRRRRAS